MKLLVTGAAGHLGSHLVPALLADGHTITAVDLAPMPAAATAGCTCRQMDLADLPALREVMAGADLIVHCASIHPWKPYTDDQYLDANIKGTWHLYGVAAALGVRRVVLTSSIAASGYVAVPPTAWPVTEDGQFPLGDLYSYTKHAQEDCARLHADRGTVRTVAIRPPAFMPKPHLETGFSLTGAYTVVEEIVSAHVAAVRVMLEQQPTPEPLRSFEAFFATNPLPYTAEDAARMRPGMDIRPVVRTYWPQACDWLVANGYKGTWVPAAYDLTKAKRLLGWEPQVSFESWYAQHGGR